MEAVTSYLKNPGGGAADVSLDDSGKMTAGGIMAGIGFGGMLAAYLLSGMPFVGQVIVYMLIFFVIMFGIMFGMSMLGVNMGSGEKGVGEAMMGAGSASMFFGIITTLALLFGKILAGDNAFMAALMITIMVGLVLILGVVCYGNWANRYKVDGMMASIVSVFTVSAALGFGSWIFGMIMGGGGGMSMMRYLM